jgi:hypothetical protein
VIANNHFVVYNLHINFPQRSGRKMYTTEIEVEKFLEEYKHSRVIIETTIRAILNRALEFERKFQKPFYMFNTEEIIKMYKTAHAISDKTLQNTNLTLKHASRWMIDAKKLDIKSTYEDVTKELILNCVDVKKKDSMILTKDDLIGIRDGLLNWTDKGILTMLFLGAGSNWLKELTFFDMSQISQKEHMIYFRTGKTIPITEEDYELIKNACEEEELVSFGGTSRISKVQSYGFFKVRFNALSASDNPNDEQDLERRFRFIQRRLLLISKDLNVKLTSGGIQTGGLLHLLKQGVEESGLTFREYVKTKEAKELARRYDIFSDLYTQILVDKFEGYFQ